MYKVEQLQAGDVILVIGTSCLAKGIQWATVNQYSHAAIVGHGVLIEAVWPDVATAALETYEHTGWRFTTTATPLQKQTAVQEAHARVGTPYGLEELALDAGRDIFHIPWTHRLPGMNRLLTCSGLVAYVYKAAGYPLTYALFPSPADLSYSPVLHGMRYW